jgi:hypothetical protein
VSDQIKSDQIEWRLSLGGAAEARVLNVVGESTLSNLLLNKGIDLLEVTLGALGGLVPVGSRVAKALADGNRDTGAAADGVEDLGDQVADSVDVHVVEERDGTESSGTLLEKPESNIGLGRSVVLPVKSVDISTDDVVAKGLHDGESVGAVAEVGGSHVGRVLSDDVEEISLKTGHLRADLGTAQSSEVRVAVSVGANLVTLVDHSLDNSLVVVDVAPVVAIQEESGLVAVLLELIKKLGGVLERTIVKGEGNVLGHSTGGDGGADGDSSGSGLDETSVGGELEERELHFERFRR